METDSKNKRFDKMNILRICIKDLETFYKVMGK